MKGHLSILVLWLLLLTVQDVAGADELRLADGGSPCAGRVEVKHQDQWGTVRDDGWDMADAGVVCKQLGCGSAVNAPGNAHFGRGSGPIWLNNVACDYTKSALWHCGIRRWGESECGHGKDGGVTCSGVNELRLADGGGPCAGRVEVKHQDQWGTVCQTGWDMADAGIVCKQLGCGAAVSVHHNAHFGAGSGPVWLNNVACDSTKSALWHCGIKRWGESDCGHGEDAGVTCSGAVEVRLVDGGSPCAGRVEVKLQDRWGTVCSDRWDMADAVVVCKQLGCGAAVSVHLNAHFGRGSGAIWLDEVACDGSESALWHCGNEGFGESDCGHGEDAGVTCSGLTERTDSPNNPADSGRLTAPVIICVILGALLCLVLIILGAKVRNARAQHRVSRRPLDPFSEAVYEEVDYNLMREKQEMFSRSVSYSDDSVAKLQYDTRDSEGENDPGSEQDGASPGESQLDYDNVEEPALNDVPQTPDGRDAPALPGDVTGDDAREVSDPEGDPGLGQNDEQGTGVNDRDKDSQTGWSRHSLRSEVISGMEKETPSLPPGDTGYDDVGHALRRQLARQTSSKLPNDHKIH
ncbi:antigen WC1.1-like [Mauremys reevesii]|uniref:antigen WC1.1-like n=1 Tax=Mauremys reevesii TaxID=260615 RepID=UPI00193F9C8B|nr:antigen WC1.1-like [Mauremys reevesii]